MKRNILFLLIMAISVVAFGQKKPKINNALQAAQEGNLQEAKEIIDQAIEHEKTRDDAKTWYYRGLIYAAIDTTANASQNLNVDPLEESMAAFNKAVEINGENNELYISGPNGLPVLRSQQIQQIWGHYLNKGVISFQNDDLEGAIKNFTRSQIIKPQDTIGYIYAGMAAQSAKKYDLAAENYYKLINELNHHDPDIYNSLIYIESNVRDNDDKALELIRKAKEHFPENPSLAKSEINLLIQLDRVDEAKAELETAIANEPQNADLYFSLGVMEEELGNTDKALEAYQKGVEIDPNHQNSNFNIAVIYFNKAVETFKERNSLGITSAEMKKSAELQKKGEAQLREALPYWEKVRSLDPSNKVVLEQLRYIYTQLKNNDKAEEIQAEMDKYGYKDDM